MIRRNKFNKRRFKGIINVVIGSRMIMWERDCVRERDREYGRVRKYRERDRGFNWECNYERDRFRDRD